MTTTGPAFLPVGTPVSAKYRGAFCEANVKKIEKAVKVKVVLRESQTAILVPDEDLKGTITVGATVQVKHPDSGDIVEGVISKIQDSSKYHVVFNDGDEMTLRRTQMCLKGDKHFMESETLDNLPLSHPEHFSTPVLPTKKGKRQNRSGTVGTSETEDSDDESVAEEPRKRQQYRGDNNNLVGQVMYIENDKRKGALNPVLVCLPDAAPLDRKTKDHILVRSFRDSKFLVVHKRDLKDFTREIAIKNEDKPWKNAMEKALLYVDGNNLPPNWDQNDLLGTVKRDDEEDESSDDEPNEEKDHFVASLIKFMDERGTPINKAPTMGSKDLNFYRLFRVVQRLGGYNKVSNNMKWRLVHSKMGLPPTSNASNVIRNAYKKYLHAYEDFYRKLGSTMGTISRPGGRSRHNSGRSFLAFRGRDKEAAQSSPRQKAKEEEKVEEKPIEKTPGRREEELAGTTDDDSELEPTPSTSQQEQETPKRPPPRKEQATPAPDLKEVVKMEREKREDLRARKEEKKEEEEKKAEEKKSGKKEKETKSEAKKEKDEAKPEKPKAAQRKLKEKEEKEKETKPEVEEKEDKTESGKEGSSDDGQKKRVTRRKSNRLDEAKKEEECPKQEEPRKKGPKTVTEEVKKKEKPAEKPKPEKKKEEKKEEEKKEEKEPKKEERKVPKVTRKSRDESKPKQEEDSDANSKEEDSEESKPKLGYIPVGSKLKVKYGRGRNQKIYEAKVKACPSQKMSGNTKSNMMESDGREQSYLVHYAGWNNRYDEWVKRERIVQVIPPGESSKDSKKKNKKISPKPKGPMLTPEGRKVPRAKPSPTPPGLLRPPSTEPRLPKGSRSPASQGKVRPTRSNSTEFQVLEIPPRRHTPSGMRRTRRSSSIVDSVDSPDVTQESEDESHMETDSERGLEPAEDDSKSMRSEEEEEEEEEEDEETVSSQELDTSLEEESRDEAPTSPGKESSVDSATEAHPAPDSDSKLQAEDAGNKDVFPAEPPLPLPMASPPVDKSHEEAPVLEEEKITPAAVEICEAEAASPVLLKKEVVEPPPIIKAVPEEKQPPKVEEMVVVPEAPVSPVRQPPAEEEPTPPVPPTLPELESEKKEEDKVEEKEEKKEEKSKEERKEKPKKKGAVKESKPQPESMRPSEEVMPDTRSSSPAVKVPEPPASPVQERIAPPQVAKPATSPTPSQESSDAKVQPDSEKKKVKKKIKKKVEKSEEKAEASPKPAGKKGKAREEKAASVPAKEKDKEETVPEPAPVEEPERDVEMKPEKQEKEPALEDVPKEVKEPAAKKEAPKKDTARPAKGSKVEKALKAKESRKAKPEVEAKPETPAKAPEPSTSTSEPQPAKEKASKRPRSRSVSPEENAAKMPKLAEDVPKPGPSTMDVDTAPVPEEPEPVVKAAAEPAKNEDVMANVMFDNTPPTTPEQDSSEEAPAPHPGAAEPMDVMEGSVSNDRVSEQTASATGSSSPSSSDQGAVPGSESSNDMEMILPHKRKADDSAGPSKKRKRSAKKRRISKSTVHGSDDSEDTNSARLSSPSHSADTDGPMSPDRPHTHTRTGPPKYNYSNLEELSHIDNSEARIQYIMRQMQRCRAEYIALKAEVATIDRRKKKSAKRKEGQKKN